MNILLCWRDVDDAESPDCNDFAKSFGQLVGPYNLCHNLSANVAYGLDRSQWGMDRNIAVISRKMIPVFVL